MSTSDFSTDNEASHLQRPTEVTPTPPADPYRPPGLADTGPQHRIQWPPQQGVPPGDGAPRPAMPHRPPAPPQHASGPIRRSQLSPPPPLAPSSAGETVNKQPFGSGQGQPGERPAPPLPAAHTAAEPPSSTPGQPGERPAPPSPASHAAAEPPSSTPNVPSFGGFFDDAGPAAGAPDTGWAPEPNAAPAPPPGRAAGGHDSFTGADPLTQDSQRVVTRRRRVSGTGWRKFVGKMTFGVITPGPSAKQEEAAELSRQIKSALLGVHVVAFVNAKGGVGKTTMTVAAGSAIARERGDRVIAVDVDTDLGTLSSRFEQQGGAKANIEALSALQDASSYPHVQVFTVQNNDRLEMLGSQNDPRSSYILNSHDFEAAMKILKLHYNIILLDCGTAITSPLFDTIANHVDSLVVVASQDSLGINGAWATVQWLHSHGFGRLLPRTVVALNATSKGRPLVDVTDAETKFRERIPGVVKVPYDVHLAEGGDIVLNELKPRTRRALMTLAGAVAQHYPARQTQQHRRDVGGSF